MRTRLFLMFAAAMAVAPSAGSAEERAEEDWRFEAKTPEEAMRVQANTIYPTLLTELRMSYLDFDAGGSSAGLELDATIPNPYVFVPGVTFSKMYTLLRIEVPTATVDLPMMERETGIGDIHAIYATLRYWNRITIGGGIATLMPSASDELLGTGKLSVGPVGGISASLGAQRLTVASITLENLTSVAGSGMRSDVNVLIVQPSFIRYLPYATYVAVEPRLRFNWEEGGDATMLLTARAGHAVNKDVVLVVEPEWTVLGTGDNDMGVTLIASFVH